MNSLINSFLAQDKPVAAICHGVTVLAWARVDGVSPLAGKQVAVPHLEGTPDQFYNGAWRNGGYLDGQRQQVLDNGGIPTAFSGEFGQAGAADDVIVDGRIITGENPASAALFGATIGGQVLVTLPPANLPPSAEDAVWTVAENAAAGIVVGAVKAADPNIGDSLTFAIVGGNQGDAFAIDPVTGRLSVANPAALDFESTPTFGLTVLVTDQAGHQALANVTVQLQDVNESPVALIDGNLVVRGTAGDDTIYLWSGATKEQAFAWVNGTAYGPHALGPGGRVVVYGGDGNDRIFATDLAAPASIYGEAGHDLITGGSADDRLDGGAGVDRVSGGGGNDIVLGGDGDDFLDGQDGDDVLVGNAGNDTIDGGAGRDVLIGGLGADLIRGGASEDALFGFATASDNDDAALGAIQKAWSDDQSLDDRIAFLTSGGTGVRLNETAFDDGAADTLLGGEGDDFGYVTPEDFAYFSIGNDRVRVG